MLLALRADTWINGFEEQSLCLLLHVMTLAHYTGG